MKKKRLKKKYRILIVLLAVILVGGIAFFVQNTINGASKSSDTVALPPLGAAQTIDNKSGKASVTIAKSGYYDVTILSADNNTKGVGYIFSVNGSTTVGQYISEGSVQLFTNAVIKLSPAKFAKLSEPYTLKDNGSYLVGVQFPAGTYQATHVGHLGTFEANGGGTLPMPADINVFPNADINPTTNQNYELTDAHPTATLTLKNGELLRLKMPLTGSIVLKKE